MAGTETKCPYFELSRDDFILDLYLAHAVHESGYDCMWSEATGWLGNSVPVYRVGGVLRGGFDRNGNGGIYSVLLLL